jgi:hypothetical protein
MKRRTIPGILVMMLMIPTWIFGQSYFLQGSATNTGPDCYQLTPAIGTQTGAVWYASPLDLTQPFNIAFEIGLGAFDVNGADGIMFVLQTDGTNAIGQSGGGLGFLGFNTAFGVEFDTWQNGQYGDPVFDHIGCVSDGSVDHNAASAFGGPVALIAGNANGEDGQNHIGQIIWDPATQLVSVLFDCDLRLTQQVDLIGEVFGGVSEVFWGFTGSTGGSYNVQTVCLQENSLTTPPEITLCPGDSIQLNVVGSPGGSYQWSPPVYLSDPSIPNPWCTPESTTTYTVSYTGLCGDAIATEYTVFVEPLTLSVEPAGPFILTCDVPSINLIVNSNFPGVDYTWSTTSPGGFASTSGASAVVDEAGTVTIEASAAGGLCLASEVLEIAENTEAFEVVIESSDTQIDCDTPELTLLATPSDPSAQLTWQASGGASFTENGLELTQTSAGTLTCTVLNLANGCTTETSFTATSDFTIPVVEAGWTDTLTCKEPSAEVQNASISPQGYTALYAWSWIEGEGGMSNTSSLSPTAHLPGWYALEVVFEENGCAALDSVWVYQDPDAAVDASSITLPNVISPNQDGKNDTFRPFLTDDLDFEVLGIMERYGLQVFNRWGQVVYANAGLPIRWDGTDAAGNECAPGTYYVLVDYRITCGGIQEGTMRTEIELLRP